MQAIFVAVALGALSVMAPAVGAGSPSANVLSGGAVQEEQRVDLNTASAAELETIPGIGPAMAQRILEWRRDHGPFLKVDDLLNVRGIGAKTLDKLRPFVRIGDEERREG